MTIQRQLEVELFDFNNMLSTEDSMYVLHFNDAIY